MDLSDQIERNMTNHPPVNEDVVAVFEQLRIVAKSFALTVAELVPSSREQSLALTSAEQALMWAIAGAAPNQPEG